MALNGRQIAQICDALVEAFTKDTLRRLVRIELDRTLEAIADGENLSVVVFNLVTWAEKQGRIEDLIQAAHRQNGGHPQIRQLFADSRAWPAASPATTGAQASPPAPPGPQTSSSAPAPASIDIFLSYSRADAGAMRVVQETLRAADLSVWTDEGLEPGTQSWTAAIEEAIKQANAFVVLLSPAAKASVWVNREIGYAQLHRKPCYPLLLSGDEAAVVPLNLVGVQWIDARQDPRRAAGRLPAALGKQPAPATAPAPQAQPAQAPTSQRARAPVARPRIPEGFILLGCPINAVAFSPDGTVLASGTADKFVRLWDPATGKLLRTMEGHRDWTRSVAFSPNGEVLASGSDDTTVRLWDATSGKLLRVLEGHTKFVRSVAFSPDGRMLASGSDDQTVRLWNPATRKQLLKLTEHANDVYTVAFSPDSHVLASGCDDGAVRLWDTATGTLLRKLEGNTSFVRSVAFSPDGKVLASGNADGTVRLWDTATGTLLRTLTDHKGWIRSVAWSFDGKLLASSCDDGAVRLWAAATGKLLRALKGHAAGYVYSVAFSPDGKTLASGSADNTIRLWPVEE